MITFSYKALANGGAEGRGEGVSSVSVDSEAPISWPERSELPKAERMAEPEAVAACTDLGLSHRLAVHLARCYSAAELAWILEQTAARAQYPQSYARKLARELEAGTSGPGIAKPPRRRRRRGRKPLRLRGRSPVDRINAAARQRHEGYTPPPPRPPTAAEMRARLELLEAADVRLFSPRALEHHRQQITELQGALNA